MLPVDLQIVVDEMDLLGEGQAAYINRKTGELFSYSEDEYLLQEDDENNRLADKDLESGDFAPLPDRYEINEYAIMQRYCDSVPETRVQEALNRAIQGSGAFRRFKDLVYKEAIENEWYAFRGAAFRKIAANFLEAEGIPYFEKIQ